MKSVDKLEQSVEEQIQELGGSALLFQQAEYDPLSAEIGGYSNYSYWRSTLRSFLKNKAGFACLIILVVVLAFACIQPYLPNQADPTYNFYRPDGMMDASAQPSAEHWFGTNNFGNDLWSRVWAGTRTSLFIGVVVATVNAIIGICIGALWGYVPSLDRPFTVLYNVVDNIPRNIILILVAYLIKPGVGTIIFAECCTGWLGFSRFIRTQIITIRDREYNLASRCLGTPTKRIVTKNLLPYLVSVISLRFALGVPGAIGSEVFLTYIGLGLPVTIPSLGNLINEGRAVMMSADSRYQLIVPALVLSVITISFYVIGNAFSDAADPKNHV